MSSALWDVRLRIERHIGRTLKTGPALSGAYFFDHASPGQAPVCRQSAGRRAAPVFKMRDVSRHKSMAVLQAYVRDADLFPGSRRGGIAVGARPGPASHARPIPKSSDAPGRWWRPAVLRYHSEMGAAAADHEFGGQDTELKLSVVEAYLKSYTKALRGKWPELWYIDAFAGTGYRTERVAAQSGDLFNDNSPERIEQRRGSAKIALDVEPAFNRLVFMEQNPRHCEALNDLKTQYPGRDIEVVRGDANQLIRGGIEWDGWRRTRAVMFLDPYGMSVDWSTLEAIAKTRAIDVWYLFSLSGLYRQAARRIDDVDPVKRIALTRMLGTDEWERELYAPAAQGNLLDDPAELQREADVRGLEAYVKTRLKTIGCSFDGGAISVLLGCSRVVPERLDTMPEQDQPPPVYVTGRLALSPAAAVELINSLNGILAAISNAPNGPISAFPGGGSAKPN
jgi:three-Cys-motif partner protein